MNAYAFVSKLMNVNVNAFVIKMTVPNIVYFLSCCKAGLQWAKLLAQYNSII